MRYFRHPTYKNYACDIHGEPYSFLCKGCKEKHSKKPHRLKKYLRTSKYSYRGKRHIYQITISNKGKPICKYLHRFVFECYYKYSPEEIDHKDRNYLNNCPENLREATKSQNCHNIIYKNKTGFRGVTETVIRGRSYFRAMIRNNKKKEHIGNFPTAEEAHHAYCQRAKELYGKFALTATYWY